MNILDELDALIVNLQELRNHLGTRKDITSEPLWSIHEDQPYSSANLKRSITSVNKSLSSFKKLLPTRR